MPKPTQKTGWKTAKLLSYYRPYRGLFAADLLCALLVSCSSLLLPLCVRHVTGVVLVDGGDPVPRIWRSGLVMAALIAVQALCGLFYDHMGHVMGGRMERDMRNELFEHCQKLPLGFFERTHTGELLSRVTNDLLNLAELYHHGPENLFLYLLTFVGTLVILLRINAPLALAVFAFLPVLLLYSLLFQRPLKRSYRASRERIAQVGAQLEDSFAGMRVVKSFCGEALETGRFRQANERYYRAKADIYRSEAYYYSGLTHFFTPLLTAGVVVLGGLRIAGGSLSLPDLLAFLLYCGYLTNPILQLAQIAQQFQDGRAGFHRFLELLSLEPEPALPPRANPSPFQGAVDFSGVSFRYREGEPYVLRHLSLTVRAGETVALVGSSGVGKTTLCSLLPRFYEVEEGCIRIDGTDIRTIPLEELRGQIGVVHQDAYLFTGTILDNIRYGCPQAGMEEVVRAAQEASIHSFIESLPQGYQTQVGQRGVRLSGGQRQRISIARVFLKAPPILIFDEATSALDSENERAVQASLRRLSRSRTTFVIAHRLSTIRRADRILVLTEEGIAEQGTHRQLLERDGHYARLYRSLA